jgi:hypothetical protein
VEECVTFFKPTSSKYEACFVKKEKFKKTENQHPYLFLPANENPTHTQRSF